MAPLAHRGILLRSAHIALRLFIALAFVAGGMAVLGFGVHGLVVTSSWIGATLPARATVEKRVLYGVYEGPFYDATVRFTTADGQQVLSIVRQTVNGLAVGDPEVGRTVSIRYDPRDPTSVKLSTWSEVWWHPIFLLLSGGVWLAILTFILLRGLRNRRPTAKEQD